MPARFFRPHALITSLSLSLSHLHQPRLSERNAVDMVAKLQALGYLGVAGGGVSFSGGDNKAVLATADGRGYVTAARLGEEVVAAVAEAGGRAALVDLAGPLGVDLAHVEAVVGGLVAPPAAEGLARAGGDLILPSFWAALAAEVAALLADGGACPSIGDLAARFGLAADTLVAGLTPHLAPPAGGGAVPARVR